MTFRLRFQEDIPHFIKITAFYLNINYKDNKKIFIISGMELYSNNYFIFYQVGVTSAVGAHIHHEISNDFSYMGAPFLMGTVALGKGFKSFVQKGFLCWVSRMPITFTTNMHLKYHMWLYT